MTKDQKDTIFMPYQLKWIHDRSQLKIMEKSRQIGISWATAYALVRNVATPKNRYDSWITSRDELQGKLLLDDCKFFARLFHVAFKDLGSEFLNSQSVAGSQNTLLFANNKRIQVLSSCVDAQAGKRGTRILDEFALHPSPQSLYAIAYPGITWGGSLEIISTHRGANNYFNSLIKEITENGNPKKFSHHKVTFQDALEQGFLKKLKKNLMPDDPRLEMDDSDYFDYVRSSCADEETFLQEYMCQPMDDTSSFIPAELTLESEYPRDYLWKLDIDKPTPLPRNHYYTLGVDIARTQDLTVFWLVEITVDLKYLTRSITALKNQSFANQEEVLECYLKLPNIARVCIDQTGIGRQFAERAIQRYTRTPVEGVNFSHQVKEQLAHNVRKALELERLKIPSSDVIRSDFRAIKRETTLSGNYRFSADRSKSGHADYFWALALALHAAHPICNTATHYEQLSQSNCIRRFNARTVSI